MLGDSKTIEAILELRFGRMEAQALKFGRAKLVRSEVQFKDIRVMMQLLARYRARVRMHIKAYRLWQGAHEVEQDGFVRLYSAVEGAVLARQVSDSVKLWFFAHVDYHEMRRSYLKICMGAKIKVDWEKAA